MGTIQDKKANLQWKQNPVSLPVGSKINVHYGIKVRPGTILRRGHDRFRNEYRVQDDKDGIDSWIDCWRCHLINSKTI